MLGNPWCVLYTSDTEYRDIHNILSLSIYLSISMYFSLSLSLSLSLFLSLFLYLSLYLSYTQLNLSLRSHKISNS